MNRCFTRCHEMNRREAERFEMIPGDPRWCARLAAARATVRNPLSAALAVEPPAMDLPRTESAVADRADFDPNYDPARAIVCEICGSEMRYIASCKILCSNCGYRRDCSDP